MTNEKIDNIIKKVDKQLSDRAILKDNAKALSDIKECTDSLLKIDDLDEYSKEHPDYVTNIGLTIIPWYRYLQRTENAQKQLEEANKLLDEVKEKHPEFIDRLFEIINK